MAVRGVQGARAATISGTVRRVGEGARRGEGGAVDLFMALVIFAVVFGGAVWIDIGRAYLANIRVIRAVDAGAKALAGFEAGPRRNDALVVRHFYGNLPTADYGLALSVSVVARGDVRMVEVRTEVETVILRYLGRPRFVFRSRIRVPSNVVWLTRPTSRKKQMPPVRTRTGGT